MKIAEIGIRHEGAIQLLVDMTIDVCRVCKAVNQTKQLLIHKIYVLTL